MSEINLTGATAFTDAVREAGVGYHDAYNAYLQRRIDATRIAIGRKNVLVLTAEQRAAFARWAESFATGAASA
jgi:hypothetical protein